MQYKCVGMFFCFEVILGKELVGIHWESVKIKSEREIAQAHT